MLHHFHRLPMSEARFHLPAMWRHGTASKLFKSPDLQMKVFLREKQPWISHPAQLIRVHLCLSFSLDRDCSKLARPHFPATRDLLEDQGCYCIVQSFFFTLYSQQCPQQTPLFQGGKFRDFSKPCTELLNSIPCCFPTWFLFPQEAPSQQQLSSQLVFLSLTSSHYKKSSVPSPELLQLTFVEQYIPSPAFPLLTAVHKYSPNTWLTNQPSPTNLAQSFLNLKQNKTNKNNKKEPRLSQVWQIDQGFRAGHGIKGTNAPPPPTSDYSRYTFRFP